MKAKFILLSLLFLFSFSVCAQSQYAQIIGTWVRPDGGYTLDIKDVSGDGKMDASYFNPNPINVAVAQATIESEKINVFVELQDIGYPGSNYTLVYDPDTDCLIGVYHHLVINQDFDVYFVRK
jgi:hypothetical protein